MAGRARGYQPPHAELREGEAGAGEGAQAAAYARGWAGSEVTGHHGDRLLRGGG